MNYSCFLSKSILLYVYVINLAWCYSFEMEYFILYIIPLSKSNFNFIRITTMQLMTNKIPLKLTLVQNSDKFCIMKLNLHFLAIHLFTSMSYCAIFVKKSLFHLAVMLHLICLWIIDEMCHWKLCSKELTQFFFLL